MPENQAKRIENEGQNHTNFGLIINQVSGLYQAKGDNMVAYLARVQEAMKKFRGVRMEQVPQEKNHRADVLVKIAAGEGHALPRGVPLQLIPRSSITKAVEVLPVGRPPCWMDPIADYLQSDILPTDPDQARQLKRIATWYCLVDGYLYHKGKSLPLLRWLHPEDAR